MIGTSPLAISAIAGLLLAVGAGSTTYAAPAQSVADLLRQKTQAFSDAGMNGDKASLDAMLAPDVAFTNEDGSTPTKAEILAGASPPPPGVRKSIRVTEFEARIHGPVAVATFVDVLDETIRGQTLRFRYRSTEVWRDDPVGWRLIASQTLTLSGDPPAARLPAAVLDGYAGTCDAGAGVTVRITRNGDAIDSSTNGGTPIVMRPELKDVFFLPGQPQLRRIFERDASGRIVGYVNRIAGQDLRARRT